MEDARILILTPFRNESHSFSLYQESLCGLNYPKKLIDAFWLENDSSDDTLRMLEKGQHESPFNSTILKSINILGAVKKRKPGRYVKDIRRGKGRRLPPWYVIWNEHFLPFIRESDADYVLCWYADLVAPSNIITEYLKVFEKHKDAGWVGGAMHRRHPYHEELSFPRPFHLAKSKEIIEVSYLGHCWMCPRSALGKTELSPISPSTRDIHQSLITDLSKEGLRVYYQPSVYLKHISTNGKIYKHEIEQDEDGWIYIRKKDRIKALLKRFKNNFLGVNNISVKSSSFYNDRFKNIDKYLVPPRDSTYYPLWRAVLDKLNSRCSILDVGCGPGQFARLCVEEGHSYVGIDFSQVAIEQGRKKTPEAIFHLVDVVKDKSLLKKGNYDTVTLIEFLEHIENDLEVINSIPEGKNVVFSVPKYWSKAHVRAFNTRKSVYIRYDELMEIKDISEVSLGSQQTRNINNSYNKKDRVIDYWKIYILSGIRKCNKN